MYAAIGRQVYHRRRELNLTQEQLSQKAGISLSFLGHIERGTRKMSLETFVALCCALECSPNDLIGLEFSSGRTIIDTFRTALIKLEELNKRGLLNDCTEKE